jgi:membrane associated rhomboid family serine protease
MTMGIYNRDYYREWNKGTGSWGLDGLTPVVKFLLLANIAVFLLQIFVTRDVRLTPLEIMRQYNPAFDKLLAEKEAEGPEAVEKLKKEYPELDKLMADNSDKVKTLDSLLYPPTKRVSVVQEWCELDTKKVVYGGQVWRLLTHAFCHDRYGLWHIFLNMLCLYWFGGTLETMYGGREFLLFYLTAAVIAGLAFVGLDLYTGSSVPAVGASGAVLAVMMLYTMHFPCETICICWIFPVEMRWVMAFYVIWDLHPILLALAGDQFFSGIAHAAHLGGLVFGFLYAKFEWRLEAIGERLGGMRRPRRERPRLRLVEYPHPELEPDDETARMDEVLQKIHESGEASLTPEDREILRQASERVKSRRRNEG